MEEWIEMFGQNKQKLVKALDIYKKGNLFSKLRVQAK